MINVQWTHHCPYRPQASGQVKHQNHTIVKALLEWSVVDEWPAVFGPRSQEELLSAHMKRMMVLLTIDKTSRSNT